MRRQAIQELKFPHTLSDVERYLGLVGSLRHYIKDYVAKAAPLEERKALLLKGSPAKGQAGRNFVNKKLLHNPTTAELQAFDTLQSVFKKLCCLLTSPGTVNCTLILMPARKVVTALLSTTPAGNSATRILSNLRRALRLCQFYFSAGDWLQRNRTTSPRS